MDRPMFQATIDELEQLVSEKRNSRSVLGRVREELTYRETDRARQLLREVDGLLGGEIPLPPKPPAPEDPNSQIPLL